MRMAQNKNMFPVIGGVTYYLVNILLNKIIDYNSGDKSHAVLKKLIHVNKNKLK